MSTKHIYENKGLRLYYELPDDTTRLANDVQHLVWCLMEDSLVDEDRVSHFLLNRLLAEINITTVDHEGGWKG